MSDKIRKRTLFQNKKYFQKKAQTNNIKSGISPGVYNENAQKIRNTINSQINQIKLEFNKYCRFNKYTNRTLFRNQKSLDNLFAKKRKIKEKKLLDDKNNIRYNFSLKEIKPKIYKKFDYYNIKSVDIDLNKENILPNDYNSKIKINQINKKRTSNNTSINKKKTEYSKKSKNTKKKFDYFNKKEFNIKSNEYNFYNKENIKAINSKRNTNPNTLFKEDNLYLKNINKKIKSQNESKRKGKNGEINLNLKANKNNYKLVRKVEMRKLSFDNLESNIEKNKSSETKYASIYTNFEKNDLLINLKKEKIENKKLKEELSSEDMNNYNLMTENEQGLNNKINEIKINNYIINKPKEENMKFSSLKYNFSENDEKNEKNSEISKIIIGQIEGYKDIIEQDKSKSLMELLSRISFSYAKNNTNNKQSIVNGDNINSHFFGEINIDNKEINNINITNIKNVDEDFDSEDFSSIIRNNIKSKNKKSKEFIYKRKINLNCKYKNNIKTSMNTNNTTISSKEKEKEKNKIIKAYNNEKNFKNKKMDSDNLKQLSPLKIKMRKKYEVSNLNNKKESKNIEKTKNNYKYMNKNEIRKNLDITRRLDTIKSTTNINKKIDTNLIFNSPKKLKKKIKSNFINDLNKSPLKTKKIIDKGKEKEIKSEKDGAMNTNKNRENETIINPCFNDADNEICYDNDINKNNNAFNQCILF